MTTAILVGLGLNTIILIVVLIMLKRKPDYDPAPIKARLETMEKIQSERDGIMRDELARMTTGAQQNSKDLRSELQNNLQNFNQSIVNRLMEIAQLQKGQLDTFSQQLTTLTASNEHRLEKMRETVQEHLKSLQQDTGQKLDKIRITVDEKLHETLETRLGESFKLVSERLEAVHKGLGEMQALAAGVGDLKKVLTNVKSRGTWGEIHLGNIIEEILTPEQYGKNIAMKKGREEVEYAVKLPGRNESGDEPVWLPIDAKFPMEDYARFIDAHEKGDVVMAEEAHKQLAASIKKQAQTIHDKYVNPPNTTDFAIMFLPTESLFAEVLRFPALCEEVQRKYRVSIAGPTTLGALLNSLSMGFKSLAIEKRSSEVRKLLAAVKTQFSKFSDVLEQTSKKLQEATHKIDDATKRSRIIENKLRGVEALPASEAALLLDEGETSDSNESD